jgi:hypothetical protein
MGIVNTAMNLLLKTQAKEIIKEGLDDALNQMQNMVANEGMQTIFDTQVVPEFTNNAKANPEDGWTDVVLSDYMDFMGNLINEGNSIMSQAYDEAYIIVLDI